MWCDKARPGEFGGWVTRITEDKIESSGTSQILADWRERDRQAKADAAYEKWLDDNHDRLREEWAELEGWYDGISGPEPFLTFCEIAFRVENP